MSVRKENSWTIFDMLKGSMDVSDIITTAILLTEVKAEANGMALDTEEIYNNMFTIAGKMRLSAPFISHDDLNLIYSQIGSDFDWENLLYQCYSSDRNASVLVTTPLLEIMTECVNDANTVLIAEGEKFTPNLKNIVRSHRSCHFTITTEDRMYALVIEHIFAGYENVTIQRGSIYKQDFSTERFDQILSVPSKSTVKVPDDFLCQEHEMFAFENLLLHLSTTGELSIVLPARITFASGDVSILRQFVTRMYNLEMIAELPKKTLVNTGLKTYLIRVAFGRTDKVTIKTFKYIQLKNRHVSEQYYIEVMDASLVTKGDLEENGDWNINKLLAKQNNEFYKYQAAEIRKISLGDVAKAFRGKSTFKNEKHGNVGIVNISNLGEHDIDYENLDKFYAEDERKISNYILETGDILIPSRCTTVHSAVFKKQDYPCIASSNVIVIRPNANKLNSTYLKIFIDSPVGNTLIRSQQQGTSIMNISYKDLEAMEIPLLSLDEQNRIAEEYTKSYQEYNEKISEAKRVWDEKLGQLQRFWDDDEPI